MSNLPTTLEEMQFAILQGDLSTNPKLQPSTIPSRDKELKTVAKKIIPAINELLKTVTTCKTSVEQYSSQVEAKVQELGTQMGESLKTEQMEVITQKVEEIKTNVSALMASMQETLKQDYAEEMEQKLANILENMDATIETKIQAMISDGKIGTGTGGDALKKVFHSKALLKKGESMKAPFKFSELQDIKQQITGTAYSEACHSYVYNPELFNFSHASGSWYQIYTTPIDVEVNKQTDEITLYNHSDTYDMQLYFFTLE